MELSRRPGQGLSSMYSTLARMYQEFFPVRPSVHAGEVPSINNIQPVEHLGRTPRAELPPLPGAPASGPPGAELSVPWGACGISMMAASGRASASRCAWHAVARRPRLPRSRGFELSQVRRSLIAIDCNARRSCMKRGREPLAGCHSGRGGLARARRCSHNDRAHLSRPAVGRWPSLVAPRRALR